MIRGLASSRAISLAAITCTRVGRHPPYRMLRCLGRRLGRLVVVVVVKVCTASLSLGLSRRHIKQPDRYITEMTETFRCMYSRVTSITMSSNTGSSIKMAIMDKPRITNL